LVREDEHRHAEGMEASPGVRLVELASSDHVAPALFQISRRWSALASDVLNTQRPPTVGNSTSPLKYQSKSGPTSPDGSAMNPSSDIAAPALTVPIVLASRAYEPVRC